MNVDIRRKVTSWLLLAVFVPMVIVSSLHVHHPQQTLDTECSACINHHCGGHLGQHTAPLHACVLCQFLTLPLLPASDFAVVLYNKECKINLTLWQRNVVPTRIAVVGLRAPPAV